MQFKTFFEVLKRALDYLSGKYPWFAALLRNKKIAICMFFLYLFFIVKICVVIHGGKEEGWADLIKTFSPFFFDLMMIFLLSSIFIFFRGYFAEEKSRIDVNVPPDPRFFMSVPVSEVAVVVDDSNFFTRHPAVSAILDALPINMSDFFFAHAGSLDIPKLALQSISIDSRTGVSMRLGACSFKEFFFTHHFADYQLSRSSSKDSGGLKTLRNIFSPVYERAYMPFFEKKETTLNFLAYTPNTLGVTGCVRVKSGSSVLYFFQFRGFHESAARGVIQLSYAGTIEIYPDYIQPGKPVNITSIAQNEFDDEFMQAAPGKIITNHDPAATVTHNMVGLCANSQYLFQPEIFILTEVVLNNHFCMKLLEEKYKKSREGFIAFTALGDVHLYVLRSGLKIRPLCDVAIQKIYMPHQCCPVKHP
ncbi:MAG: hypothetical protein DESF_00772 [Desulfovibrio sp.]